MKTPEILVVVAFTSNRPGHMNWLALRDAIRENIGDKVAVDMTSLTSLIFDISPDNQTVVDCLSGRDVSSYDFVAIRNVGKTPELGITLAHYLRRKGVNFTDSYLETNGGGKLSCSMIRSTLGLPFPRTIYTSARRLVSIIKSKPDFNYPFILKADKGKKGRDNYLVHTEQQLEQTLAGSQEVIFIAQEFVPNDGDIRALVLDGSISLVIKRRATEGTHLNNVSAGGSSVLLPLSDLSAEVQRDIIKSAEVEGLQVAGVDVIFDKLSGKHYILEVNKAPEIGTGAFVQEKIAAYSHMIASRVEKN